MSSDGPAGTVKSSKMGIYKKEAGQEYNNRPVYLLDTGGQFLFYSDVGYWTIGPQASGISGGILTMKSGLLTPPSTGWKYSDNDGWKDDPQLKVSGEMIDKFCHIFNHYFFLS